MHLAVSLSSEGKPYHPLTDGGGDTLLAIWAYNRVPFVSQMKQHSQAPANGHDMYTVSYPLAAVVEQSQQSGGCHTG